MEYGTIKIPKTEFDKHNERRQDLGLTWQEYLEKESVDVEEGTPSDEIQSEIEEFREEWHEEIKKAQEIAESARDNTEQIKEGMRG